MELVRYFPDENEYVNSVQHLPIIHNFKAPPKYLKRSILSYLRDKVKKIFFVFLDESIFFFHFWKRWFSDQSFLFYDVGH